MSWRDQFQTGSFRGAPFRTQSGERTGGRRVAVTEMPSRDDPLTEDMGRRARQFSIECHVVGADYFTARDALIEALEAPGPALLIHPWYGQMMAVVLDYRATESTEDGGLCWFTITFGEAGIAAPAPAAIAGGQLGVAEANRQAAQIPAKLAGKFTIEGAAAFVEQAATDLVKGMATASQIAAGLQGGVGPALRAFETGLALLPANMQGLLRAPLSLGQSIVGLVASVSALNTAPRRRMTALTLMLDWAPAATGFPVVTPDRQREAGNRRALMAAFRVATAAELARTVSAMRFASYEDAVATRDAIATRLDVLAVSAVDDGDDPTADALDALRRAISRDIAVRGANLARTYGLALQRTQPALVLAARVYGHPDVEARAAEIVARNGILHPLFVPGGAELQLLTATDAGAAA